ncbi:MAG: hypothetical protein JO287_24295 [Pseudonocardiales bacterium]|nr:hypothetical protein [Pseudonocardiales bacterium]
MDRLDGNAIAGTLFTIFDREMTTATRICASCGTKSQLAELTVYPGGPGVVARCGHCDNVVMVIVEIRGISCVDLWGLVSLEMEERT